MINEHWLSRRIDGLSPAPARPVVLKQVDAQVRIDAPGSPRFLPALLAPDGVVEPLLAYFCARWQSRPRSWMNSVLRAAGLFIRYASVQPDTADETALLRGFAARLRAGTLGENGHDPTGLGWRPASEAAADRTLKALARLFDFLAAVQEPAVPAADSRFGHLVRRSARAWRADPSCLPLRRTPGGGPRALGAASARAALPPPPPFPEDRLAELLFDGFRSATGCDWRGMLITLLLNGAGLEIFEPFHLYLTDVLPLPGEGGPVALCIRHPAQTESEAARAGNARAYDALRRAAYLRRRWKGGAGGQDDAAFRLCWSCPDLEALFGSIWPHYRNQIAALTSDHPYAFVSLRGASRGQPYTVAQFSHAHAAACERIGLPVSRARGTTLEGHRVAYERRLAAAREAQQLELPMARCA